LSGDKTQSHQASTSRYDNKPIDPGENFIRDGDTDDDLLTINPQNDIYRQQHNNEPNRLRLGSEAFCACKINVEALMAGFGEGIAAWFVGGASRPVVCP
jgi:hypothetical protein